MNSKFIRYFKYLNIKAGNSQMRLASLGIGFLLVLMVVVGSEIRSTTEFREFINSRISEFHQAQLHLAPGYRQEVEIKKSPSPGVESSVIEEARNLHLREDFKYLSDLSEKLITDAKGEEIYHQAQELSKKHFQKQKALGQTDLVARAESRKVYIQYLIDHLYEFRNELLPAPAELTRVLWKLEKAKPQRQNTVNYIENLWTKLVKVTPTSTTSSLIPVPNPIIIPGARFQESYYWDSYFGIQGLLKTKRWTLAALQIENFLFMIKNYGLMPNGLRDYYLTRSQPPLIVSMVRDVYEAGIEQGQSKEDLDIWLKTKAYPLLKKDYFEFWMNPETRLDANTGLNHHWDDKNTPRVERHGVDNEEVLGRTYRDVRAEAESGKDFTDVFEGQTSHIAGVLLNSILYKAEKDLEWMAKELHLQTEAEDFNRRAESRKQSVNKLLWEPDSQTFKDYNLETKKRVEHSSADIFATLWSELASTDQAESVQKKLSIFEKPGGIVMSTLHSGKQWDAPYGWAPHQFFAMDGLRKYGFKEDAKRIAEKWTSTIDRIHAKTGVILEKVDAERADVPLETGDKYETQKGFLWTNAVYLWALTEILNYTLAPL